MRNGLPIQGNGNLWISDRVNPGANKPKTIQHPVLGRSITHHLRTSQEKLGNPKQHGTPGHPKPKSLASKKPSLIKTTQARSAAFHPSQPTVIKDSYDENNNLDFTELDQDGYQNNQNIDYDKEFENNME